MPHHYSGITLKFALNFKCQAKPIHRNHFAEVRKTETVWPCDSAPVLPPSSTAPTHHPQLTPVCPLHPHLVVPILNLRAIPTQRDDRCKRNETIKPVCIKMCSRCQSFFSRSLFVLQFYHHHHNSILSIYVSCTMMCL